MIRALATYPIALLALMSMIVISTLTFMALNTISNTLLSREDREKPQIHGYIYDNETGLIYAVSDANGHYLILGLNNNVSLDKVSLKYYNGKYLVGPLDLLNYREAALIYSSRNIKSVVDSFAKRSYTGTYLVKQLKGVMPPSLYLVPSGNIIRYIGSSRGNYEYYLFNSRNREYMVHILERNKTYCIDKSTYKPVIVLSLIHI